MNVCLLARIETVWGDQLVCLRKQLFIGATLALLLLPFRADGAVDFHEEVFPILEEKCFRCHSSQKQKGDLRLDSPIWIQQGGESGDVVIAGDPEESPLYYLTTYPEDDPDYMPSKGTGLSQGEQALLRRWIEEGASYEEVMGGSMRDVDLNANPVGNKYSAEIPLPPARYDYSVSMIGIVAALEEMGLKVDTVNHDAEWLELTYTYADSRAAYDLAELESITDVVVKLNYARSLVRSEDLVGVGDFQALRYVDLRRTGIDDDALEHLARVEGLEYLNLFETSVSDVGIKKLRSLSGLKQLYLHGTDVTPAGVEALRKAIPGLKIVR